MKKITNKKIRNKELYEFLKNEYCAKDSTLTVQDVANKFGLTLGATKNFMYRHKLNKKDTYKKKKLEICKLIDKGAKTKDIMELYNCSAQYVYYLNKNR